LRPEVEQLLERTGLLQEIGRANCFETTNDALLQIRPDANKAQDLLSEEKLLATKP
jgi:hypothetical protein